MIRVTADSNIYISALHFGGPPDKFLDLARTGVIHLTIFDDILAEVTRVLRDKFGWSQEALSTCGQHDLGDPTGRDHNATTYVRPSVASRPSAAAPLAWFS